MKFSKVAGQVCYNTVPCCFSKRCVYICVSRVQRLVKDARHKNPMECRSICTEHLNFQNLGWHRNRVLRNLNTERFRCQYLSLPRTKKEGIENNKQDHRRGDVRQPSAAPGERANLGQGSSEPQGRRGERPIFLRGWKIDARTRT